MADERDAAVTPVGEPSAGLPSLTAIVPTRDRPLLLRRAVQSILEQEYDGEITCLVVFDQSEPVEIDIAMPPRRHLRLITNTRKSGLAGGRNSGILAADTELIAFCDDDDEWLPGKVAAQVALLRQAREAGEKVAVLSSGILINYQDKDMARLPPRAPLEFRDFLLHRHNEVHPCTFLAVREAVLGPIGLVDEDIPGSYAEDYEWLLRASQVAPVRCVPQPLTRVYWHSASYFASKWEMIRDGLTYLLARYPEFASEPEGLARIEGQIALAHAGLGERHQARRLAVQALRRNWKAKHAYLALPVSTGLFPADWATRAAHAIGRGI